MLSSNPDKSKEEGYNDDTNHVFKKSNLEELSITMETLPNPGEESTSPPDAESHFILSPVNGQADVEVNKLASGIDNPKVKVFPRVSNIQLTLSQTQYKTLLQSVDWFAQTQVLKSNLKYRPQLRISEGEAPKVWWQYAISSIRRIIQQREAPWTKAYYKLRREKRIAYMRLFARRELKVATTVEGQSLNEMERELSVNDIKWFRTITRRYLQMLRHEEEPAEDDSEVKKEIWNTVKSQLGDIATKDLDTAPSSGGWLSMLSWSSAGSKKEDPRWEETGDEVGYVLGWTNPEEIVETPALEDEGQEGQESVPRVSREGTPAPSTNGSNSRTSTDATREVSNKLPEAPSSYATVAAKPFSFGTDQVPPQPSNTDVFLHVDLRLLKGSLVLRRGQHDGPDSDKMLAAIAFNGFRPIFRTFTQPNEQNAPSTWEFTSKLAKLIVTDESNPHSRFKKIVQAPRPAGDIDGSASIVDLDNKEPVDFDDPTLWDNPLLSLNAAQLSPKSGFNMRVDMRLEESLIFYHKRFVEEIVRFFRPPDKHETLNALFDAMMEATKEFATETIDSLRTAEQNINRSALEFAITETKPNIIQLDLKAPLIILPEEYMTFL